MANETPQEKELLMHPVLSALKSAELYRIENIEQRTATARTVIIQALLGLPEEDVRRIVAVQKRRTANGFAYEELPLGEAIERYADAATRLEVNE